MSTWLVVIISIFFSAFFSGMEIAFVGANKLMMELENKKGSLNGRIIARFRNNPNDFITTMLLGNNIALVIYGIKTAEILDPHIVQLLGSYSSDSLQLLIQTLCATLIILFTAEFIPKMLFRINSNNILNFFALPVSIIFYLLKPFAWLFTKLSEFIISVVFNIEKEDEDYTYNDVDLDNYLDELSKKDEQKEMKNEIEMLKNAIDFKTVKLRECMIPRTEIEALDENINIEDLKNKFIETGFSKILIYNENIDNIIGYIHSFDLFHKPKSIKSILRIIEFYPETMMASDLMESMIRRKQSIVVVVDEFGGTSGILTQEDVFEEIFGEIEDEFDTEELIDNQISETEFLFSGRLEIDYLNKNYKFNFPIEDEYETLAGFIINHHENIPTEGDVINIDNYHFEVEKATNNRIDTLKLTVTEKS